MLVRNSGPGWWASSSCERKCRDWQETASTALTLAPRAQQQDEQPEGRPPSHPQASAQPHPRPGEEDGEERFRSGSGVCAGRAPEPMSRGQLTAFAQRDRFGLFSPAGSRTGEAD